MGGWILLVESRVLLCSDVMMVDYPSNPRERKRYHSREKKRLIVYPDTVDVPGRLVYNQDPDGTETIG